MENCTIYSHQLNFEKTVQTVKNNLPKAKIEQGEDGLRKFLTATIKGGFFSKGKTLKINYRQRQNPSYKLDNIECGLTQNLAGMANYIQSLPAKNREVKNKFMHKVMSANSEMAFMADPNIAAFEKLLKQIVQELDGFIFAQPGGHFKKSDAQHFLDKHFNLILDNHGNCEITDIAVNVDAKYHDQPTEIYTDEQLTRKNNSEEFLNKNEIKTNKDLPCVPSIEEIKIRGKKEIIDRAFALMAIAAKGEGIKQVHLERAVKGKNINSFSPNEMIIYNAEKLNDQQKAYATWRYESLYTLLWAMGKMELKYPNKICNVQEVVAAIFQPEREAFENSVQIKSAGGILDELDKIYRMNWACVDARIKGEQVGGNINPSIIYERHYALNWLTNYMGQEWDDVQTNT